ncbi:LysM peptidoglycan-binding domain-containing protein [Rhodovulum sulfidophilum]|uniref:LysM peptidoglycan-binding domain-containing protein n=1 Tax=Rhodovulum sulfidophilum TaxID=35806 RepID=UPI001924385C|nr:Ig-like domain-containing protein [Rhodovulum sulfidophilum]MBL3574784.1 LysM peptidoglycan-binding domain-containing protein [Rhodovulum sulfidophilum]MCE8430666.1 LysM peptidoglycan-binding domain-containing protein [Rhodovulum sulfidophilum]MCF4117614.1 LysM peptidoglycan-binding domain-containing protein [Rhodovulum sulfidophilum]
MPERARKAPIRGSVWTWIILGGEAVLVLMVAAWFLGRDDERNSDRPQAEEDAAVTSPAAAGQAADAANTEAQPSAAGDRSEAVPPATPLFAPPAFDLVRVTPEGGALVSGRGGAGSVVAVLVEGREAARAKADAAGDFAVLFDLGQSDEPRRISLAMLGADGRRTASEATVILAPNRSVSTATGPAGGPEDAAEGPRRSQSGAPSSATIGPPPADAAAILISDAGGVRLLEPPHPHEAPPVSGLMLDAISYDAQGAVRLAGRGRPGAALRIYIDNAPLAETGIDGAGRWTLRAPGIAAGRHVLRADLLAADGGVAARIETPFQREPAAEIAAAMPPPAGPAGVRVMTVQPGYTLWGIADRTYGRGMQYVKIFEANRGQISDPDLIYPGQIFDIPHVE